MDKGRPHLGHLAEGEVLLFETIFDEVRKALRHLYDPGELRKSALLKILPVNAHEGHIELQRMLVEAIEQLKPPSSLSTQSNSWRNYHILSSRYVQQFHQNEVASSLGLSLRQIRRQNNLALRALAGYLISQYKITYANINHVPDATLEPMENMPSQEDELRAVGRMQKYESIEVSDLLNILVRTVEPLAKERGVRLDLTLEQELPRLFVSLTSIRQAILMLFTGLIRQSPNGRLEITAHFADGQVVLSLTPRPSNGSGLDRSQIDLQFVQQLVELSDGRLEVRSTDTGVGISQALLKLPVMRNIPVLAVDDNADALQLYQRYFADTRYTFYGTTNPEQIVEIAEKLHPRIILIDVMMPGIDGWELLSRLREHPVTHAIPIIVSTILPQEQLAYTLGAAAFIRKPVSQLALLRELDHLVLTEGN